MAVCLNVNVPFTIPYAVSYLYEKTSTYIVVVHFTVQKKIVKEVPLEQQKTDG